MDENDSDIGIDGALSGYKAGDDDGAIESDYEDETLTVKIARYIKRQSYKRMDDKSEF